MLTDPLVTSNALATNATTANVFTGGGSSVFAFVCTGRGPNSSTYRYSVSSSHYIDLLVSNQKGRRTRSTVRLTEYELVADPINDTLNSVKTSTLYLVADVGPLGVGTNWTGLRNTLVRFLFKGPDLDGYLANVVTGET
jgi:hypothetical protein